MQESQPTLSLEDRELFDLHLILNATHHALHQVVKAGANRLASAKASPIEAYVSQHIDNQTDQELAMKSLALM
jgi:hypothetical protein